ncbi:redox-sensing transcriptional repressor Rex [Selenomonas sp. oral taxon 920]|uniref:redox-sensing transcriptional repressor Rex n=1 Tax=Selenomonas sp. oral taxon 920 TaxID=1884263 RepID=UPI000840B2A7|nr:redox-sensing transcriptional repressor Rex [Selenomonas sp. oral taxon 920]AOH48667.1 redox-sensing transcriptional repressor Rex [Selenomonas sp. oral taxon 920]
MQEHLSISKATVDRLPRYYRCLRQLTDEGVEIASSEELGRRLAINPEQIRKDLAFFGQFGKKGVGYYVTELKESLGNILGLDHHWNVAIIGMGHLGAALANYQGIARLGFRLAAIFDANPVVIGTRVGERRVEDIAYLAEIIAERAIQIGVIAVPAAAAQGVADRLVDAGIRGIWNFAPVKLQVPPSIAFVSEDLSVGLSSLSYYLTHTTEDEDDLSEKN